MEIYFSGIGPDIACEYFERTGVKINVLLSFADVKGSALEEAQRYKPYVENLMLDSGAFTSFGLGEYEAETMNRNFEAFLKISDKNILENTFSQIFSFDPIPDAIGFERNRLRYLELRKIYPKLTAVVHNIQKDSEEIDWYLSQKPYAIAIGKCEDKANIKKVKPWADKINATSDVIFHYLGVFRQDVLEACYPDTCDATSALAYALNGVTIYYPPNSNEKYDNLYFSNRMGKVKPGHHSISTYQYADAFFQEMEANLKIKFADFHKASTETQSLALVNIYTFLKMVDFINKKHVQHDLMVT